MPPPALAMNNRLSVGIAAAFWQRPGNVVSLRKRCLTPFLGAVRREMVKKSFMADSLRE
jgi:hypothetical protein